MPAVGPGAIDPPFLHQDDHPIGPQLGRGRNLEGRLPRAIDLAKNHQWAQAQSEQPTTRGEVDPDASRGYDYEVINAQSREIGVAGRLSHVEDLAEIRCRPLRRFRGDRKSTRLNSSHGYIS